jgi:hypothetical protein
VKVEAVMHELVSRALFEEQTKGLERIARMRGWIVFKVEYPIIDVAFKGVNKDIRIRMVCNDWNDLPPSIEFLTLSGDYLTTIRTDPKGVFNASQHPSTGRPFICMVGSREYHTHSSHVNDHWSNHNGKPGYDLGGILTQVWNAWEKIQG